MISLGALMPSESRQKSLLCTLFFEHMVATLCGNAAWRKRYTLQCIFEEIVVKRLT